MAGFVLEMAAILDCIEYFMGRLGQLPTPASFATYLVDEVVQLSIALPIGWLAGSVSAAPLKND